MTLGAVNFLHWVSYNLENLELSGNFKMALVVKPGHIRQFEKNRENRGKIP